VGENASTVRELAADGLGFLGVEVDPDRNAVARGDAEIGTDWARVRTFVIAAREDLQIAREVRQVLGR
jgi:acetate kinase